MRQISPGDLLLFYVNKNNELIVSQAITYVGVVESVSDALNLDELVRMTAKRTAYLRSELGELLQKPGITKSD